tara:strand:- start:1812 stop:2048 length:237 start_codon:yes stop_codon:yes gene_type:complete
MTLAMKKLLTPANIENVALLWDDVLEPLMAEQQRTMTTGKDGPCTPDELKGATVMYRAIEKFAENGFERIAQREEKSK